VKRGPGRSALCCALLAIAAATVLAVPAKDDKKRPVNEPLMLDGADKFVVTGRGAYVELTGNVRFHRGDVKMSSRHAVWDRTADQVRFEGDFRLDHPSGRLTAANGRYERSSGSAWAEGNAHLQDTSGRTTLDAGVIRYDRTARRAESFSAPVFRRISGTGSVRDTTQITADQLVWRETDSVAEANGRVRLIRGKLVATCASAKLDQKTRKLTLEGSPLATMQKRTLSGKSMILDVDLKKERIEKVLVLKDARGDVTGDPDTAGVTTVSRIYGDTLVAEITNDVLKSLFVTRKAKGISWTSLDTTRRDELDGDTLRLDFEAGKMRSALIKGNAKSTYHHMDKSVLKGRNVANGQTIRIAFRDGRVQRIRIEGAAKGTYYGTERRKAKDGI
jgi:lipopolysaccharide export system protein LptA